MRKKQRKGQSILEYTLLLAVVIMAIIVVLLGAGGQGGMKNKLETSYDSVTDAVTNVAGNLNTGVFQ